MLADASCPGAGGTGYETAVTRYLPQRYLLATLLQLSVLFMSSSI
jgi:hypothetical protein